MPRLFHAEEDVASGLTSLGFMKKFPSKFTLGLGFLLSSSSMTLQGEDLNIPKTPSKAMWTRLELSVKSHKEKALPLQPV